MGLILAETAGLSGVTGSVGWVSGSFGDRITWGGCGVEQCPASTPFSTGCDGVPGCEYAGGVGWRGDYQTTSFGSSKAIAPPGRV